MPYVSLQVQLGLTSSALSFMMLVMSVWQGLGTGSPTPQQRVAPLALLAAILYSNNGLPPFVLLLAPSHLKLGWAVSRMVTKAICLCIFALFILVEVTHEWLMSWHILFLKVLHSCFAGSRTWV